MEKMRQSALYMALISGLIDFMEGHDIDQEELKDVVGVLGLDFDHLTKETHPFLAVQEICRKFGELVVTEEDVEEFMNSTEAIE